MPAMLAATAIVVMAVAGRRADQPESARQAEQVEQAREAGQSGDPWEALRFLAGSWQGGGDGRWGHSTVQRDYEFVLNGTFLQARNRSVYPAQEKNPEGEVHNNWDLFSYDAGRGVFVLRQFHDEGFVNRYVAEPPADDSALIVFTTEHIENFMPGWRARETYRILGDDEFEEVFELAPPGGEFKVYVTNRFTRTHR